jgi:nucleoside 2-deoxyribosyltransferase
MKIYLAIPYSGIPELSFEVANKVAAKLMKEGHIVFSPISHTHPIAEYLDESVRFDSEYWMKQDLCFVDWCDEVRVVVIGEFGYDLIDKSKGVQFELKHAKETNKPFEFIHYEKS